MLAVFSGEVVEVPAELVAAGSRTPSPKTKASELVARFLGTCPSAAVSVRLAADLGHLAYSNANQALLRPRYCLAFPCPAMDGCRAPASCSCSSSVHELTAHRPQP